MSSTQEAGEIFGAGRGPAHAMLRSPTVLIASVGLWGMNVFFFRLFRIDYVKVLKHDLLKLEELDREQYHHKELREDDDSSCLGGGGGSPRNSPPNEPSIVQQQQQLVQRQPSSGVPTLAAAAAVVQSSVQTSEPDDEQDDDDEQQHLVADSMPDADSNAVTWKKLVGLSMLLLVLLHATYYWWLDVLQGDTIGAVLMFYTLVFVAVALPMRCTRWLRKATVITLQRTYELINPRCHCITNDGVTPPRFIPFVDVFYADAMCSLSKVFFDWGMLFHMASHYPNPVPASTHNIVIPSACAAVPYFIRARQCLIMYTVGRLQKDKNRTSHLWNAAKYSSSIFPLCLSAYQQTISKRAAQELEGLLIALLVINSVFALYWDIVMDWGFFGSNWIGVWLCNTAPNTKPLANPHKAASHTSCTHTALRPSLRFGFAMTAVIVLIDCVLRFSWVLRFAKNEIFPSTDAFVLCTQFLEVFRRALWNLLRVEWENIKHSKNKPVAPGTNAAGPAIAVEEELKSFLPTSAKLNTL